MRIILKSLPKLSLNEWYSGKHWTKRTAIKKRFLYIIKSQFKHVFPKDGKYTVEYVFHFKTRPLDCSNCVAMVKIIEDIIFEDDSPKIIGKIFIASIKDKEEFVEINVKEHENKKKME